MTVTATQSSPAGSYYRMTPFEVATGWLTGEEPPAPPATQAPGTLEPLAALHQVLLPALAHPPCVVAFSGGRDSSAVLAAACAAARAEGLPAPIAATLRYPAERDVEEEDWQERVVRHLDIVDWERVDATRTSDLLGPVAADGLRRRGVVWPPAHHTIIPLARIARGGSLVTGDGGDEVFGDRRSTALARIVTGQLPRRPSAVTAAILAAAPTTARRRISTRALRRDMARSWLLPDAQERFARALAADQAAEPLGWAAAILRLGRRRAWSTGFANQDLIASEEGTTMLRPLQEPLFLMALVRSSPRLGFPDREAAMRSVFSSVLPREVLARRSKARFNRVVFGEDSRAFVSRWTGDGVPADLVDPVALRRFWQAPVPHALSFALLQGAWLASAATIDGAYQTPVPADRGW